MAADMSSYEVVVSVPWRLAVAVTAWWDALQRRPQLLTPSRCLLASVMTYLNRKIRNYVDERAVISTKHA